MRNFQQQEHFLVPISIFFLVEESCPFLEGFPFLPFLPHLEEPSELVGCSFRKHILCLKMARNTFCKKCLCLPCSHTLGITAYTKKKKKLANHNR